MMYIVELKQFMYILYSTQDFPDELLFYLIKIIQPIHTYQ